MTRTRIVLVAAVVLIVVLLSLLWRERATRSALEPKAERVDVYCKLLKQTYRDALAELEERNPPVERRRALGERLRNNAEARSSFDDIVACSLSPLDVDRLGRCVREDDTGCVIEVVRKAQEAIDVGR